MTSLLSSFSNSISGSGAGGSELVLTLDQKNVRPGDKLTGNVTFKCRKSFDFLALRVHVSGKQVTEHFTNNAEIGGAKRQISTSSGTRRRTTKRAQDEAKQQQQSGDSASGGGGKKFESERSKKKRKAQEAAEEDDASSGSQQQHHDASSAEGGMEKSSTVMCKKCSTAAASCSCPKSQKDYFFANSVTLTGMTEKEVQDLDNEVELHQLQVDTGNYTYPFEFEIPLDCPSSFELEGDVFTKIAYTCKAYFAFPKKGSGPNISDRKEFQVFQAMPASQYNDAQPRIANEKILVSRCCCFSRTVFANISIYRTILLASRDKLAASITVDNSLNDFTIDGCTFSILMHSALQGTFGTSDYWEELCTERIDHVVKAKSLYSYKTQIKLPEDAPPTVDTFLGPISYHLKIELDIPFAPDPTWTCPIIVVPMIDESNTKPVVDFNGKMKIQVQKKADAFLQGLRPYRRPGTENNANFKPIPPKWAKGLDLVRQHAKTPDIVTAIRLAKQKKMDEELHDAKASGWSTVSASSGNRASQDDAASRGSRDGGDHDTSPHRSINPAAAASSSVNPLLPPCLEPGEEQVEEEAVQPRESNLSGNEEQEEEEDLKASSGGTEAAQLPSQLHDADVILGSAEEPTIKSKRDEDRQVQEDSLH